MAFRLSNVHLSLDKCSRTGQDMDYSYLFQVFSDSASNVAAITTWLLTQLPEDLSSFGVSDALLQEFTMEPAEEGATIFSGRAIYRKNFGGFGSSNNNDSVTEETIISYGRNVYEMALVSAKNEDGKVVPVLNSAGSRFVDPPMEPEPRLVINIDKTYGYSSSTASSIPKYFDSVPIGPLMIAGIPIPARGAKMLAMQPRVVHTRSSYKWRFSFSIEVRGKGKTYDREFLDRGYTYLEKVENSATGPDIVTKGKDKYRRIRAVQKNPFTGEFEPTQEPILLDGDGGRLEDVSLGNEVYLKYRVNPEQDWTRLSLPTTPTG